MTAARDLEQQDSEQSSIESFLEETEQRLDSVTDTLTYLEDPSDPEDPEGPEASTDSATQSLIHGMFRNFHAVKGAASFLNLYQFTEAAHEGENILQEVRDDGRLLDQPTRMAIAQSVRCLYQLLRKPLEVRNSAQSSLAGHGDEASPSTGSSTVASGSAGSGEEMVGLAEVSIRDVQRRSSTLSSMISQTVPLGLTDSRRELLSYVVVDLEKSVQDAICVLKEFSDFSQGEIRDDELLTQSGLTSQKLTKACADLRNVLNYFGSATLECDLDALQPAATALAGSNRKTLTQLIPRMFALFEIMLLRLSRLSEERDLVLHVDPLRHRLRSIAANKSLAPELALRAGATLEDVYNLDEVYIRSRRRRVKDSVSQATPTDRLVTRLTMLTENLGRLTQRPVLFEAQVEDADLPADFVTAMSGPLAQILRNCMDHGIEDAAERKTQNKSDTGNIVLSIEETDGNICICVTDDGRGIVGDDVAQRAVDRGLITKDEAARLSAAEKLRLILLPGLSTRDEVSTLSGRGVGMDLVASDVRQMGGSLTIDSTPGSGTQLAIQVPRPGARLWTLEIDGVQYGLPMESVLEVSDLDPESSPSSWQTESGPIPRASLCDLLTHTAGDAAFAIVLQGEAGQKVALTTSVRPHRERLETQTLPKAASQGSCSLVQSVGVGSDGAACLVLAPFALCELARKRRQTGTSSNGATWTESTSSANTSSSRPSGVQEPT